MIPLDSILFEPNKAVCYRNSVERKLNWHKLHCFLLLCEQCQSRFWTYFLIFVCACWCVSWWGIFIGYCTVRGRQIIGSSEISWLRNCSWYWLLSRIPINWIVVGWIITSWTAWIKDCWIQVWGWGLLLLLLPLLLNDSALKCGLFLNKSGSLLPSLLCHCAVPNLKIIFWNSRFFLLVYF